MMRPLNSARHRQRCKIAGSQLNAKRLLPLIMSLVGLLGVFFSILPDGHATTPKNVLVINAYHTGYRWSDQVVAGIRDTLLVAAPQTQLYVEHLDSKRFHSPAAFNRLADLIREKYRRTVFDAVIAADNNSISFLKQHRHSLFAGIPAVFCGANDLNPADLAGMAPITGVNEAADVRETIELALRLRPSTRRMVVVNDTTPTGRNVNREIQRIAPAFSDRLTFVYWDDLGRQDLLRQLAGLKNGDTVLFTFFFRDRTGRFFEYDDSAQHICRASPVPVFGLWEFNLGHGIVGGKLVSGLEQGQAAGQMALRVLDGEKAETIPLLMESPNRFAFDFNVMKKFGINESELPADSLIINRPQSLYAEYKPAVWGGIMAIVSLTMLILFLLVNIDKRRKMERDLLKSRQSLKGITDNLPAVVYQFYATADNRYGLNYVSDRAFEIFELAATPESFFESFSACVHEDDREPFLRSIADAAATMSSWDFEGRFVKPTGEIIWFSGNSIPHKQQDRIVFDGVLMDITDTKRTQEKLRRSERQMSQIINFLPDPTFVIDHQGRVIAWSRAMEELTGVKSEEILGRGDYEYALPFYGKRRPVMIDLVGKWNDEIANTYKDISKKGDRLFSETQEPHQPVGNRHFLNTAGPLYDDEGLVVGAIETIHDITKRRQTEASLRLMERLVKESPVVVFRWQAMENWPVVYVSENVNQFGYSAEDLLSGKISFSAIIHPDDLARVAEEVVEYSRQGVTDFKQEYRLITKSGSIRWVDDRTVIERNANGTITHYQGVVLDITERKAAQEEISKRQLFLESVLYHAPDAIITLDVQHRVVDWNPGAENTFGFTKEEALGKELDSLVSRDKARVEAGQKTQRVLSGKRVEAFETVRYKKDGTPVHVIAGGSPIMIDGILTGVVAMYTDITLLKQAQDDVKRNERMLRRIIDIVPSMIFVKNVQGRFLIANQAVADSYGMTVEALQGKLHEAVHPDSGQVKQMLADDRKAIESGQHLIITEEPYQDITGATRWLETIKVAGSANDFGEPVIVGLATDITERRAVEARIQKSERRYRTMFENTGTGTVLSESDTTLSMVNSEFAEMVGYAREEIEGKMSWTRFIVPEDVERMKAYHYDRRRDPSSAPTQWECGLVNRLGEVKRMLLKVRLIPGTQTSVGAFLDISDRKRAEEAMVEANRMLRLVLDTIPVRVFWKDRDCRYLGCNQSFAEDAGRSAPEDLIGKDDYSMAWIDQADLYREDDRHVMEAGDARINYEEPQTTPDGRTIWLQTSKVPIRDGHDNIIGVLGTYQDITERKVADEEVQRLRNYLSNIINSMPSVLVGVDLEGRVTQWNKKAEQVTGMTFERVRSQPLTSVFPQLLTEMDSVRTAIRDRRVIRDPKIPRQTDGENRFEDITIFPLVANGVEGAVIRVDDVTEQVRLEEMMIQSEKMLSVGGLAAGMAHEINNPLAGILQNTAVVENRLFGELPTNRKAAESAGTTMEAIQLYLKLRKLPTMIDNIRASGKRAAAIVKNMLSFARKSDRIISSHDLRSLLDQTIELAQADYDIKKRYDFKHIDIVREYDDEVDPVLCEGSKIQQVFLNILKNGAEAMALVKDGRPRPMFILRVKAGDSWVRVEIEDNGPGMDEKTRRRIFEPFFTTKPVGEGTGLGLSVSYFIITENHGGKMTVKTTDGGGTRFVIRLPKTGKQ